MARLRGPGGCPWDREQDHETIKQCLIEEAYEAVEAIESGSDEALCDELGDLLLQVVFHAQLAGEKGSFDFYDVAGRISEKLLRRHPHVFGRSRLPDSDAVLTQWEKIKKEERKTAGLSHHSAFDGVPKHLPALLRAEKLQRKAAKAGLLKDDLKAELKGADTLLSAVKSGAGKGVAVRILGELLFVVASLCRQMKLEPEQLLRRANERFEIRMRKLESRKEQK
jgi:tetrapyrrole methylase family protein/MazG family protein